MKDKMKYCLLKVFCALLFLGSSILESAGFYLVYMEHDSVCISHHEVSSAVEKFLLILFVPIIPDTLFALLVIMMTYLHRCPFCVAYNVTMAILCGIASVILKSGLSDCGHSAQNQIEMCAGFGFLAAALHFANAILNQYSIPYEDGWERKKLPRAIDK